MDPHFRAFSGLMVLKWAAMIGLERGSRSSNCVGFRAAPMRKIPWYASLSVGAGWACAAAAARRMRDRDLMGLGHRVVGIPERFWGGDELNGDLRYQCLQPLGAVFHTGLFGQDMADNDQRFLLTGGDAILDVLDHFPLAGLADDEDFDFRPGCHRDR